MLCQSNDIRSVGTGSDAWSHWGGRSSCGQLRIGQLIFGPISGRQRGCQLPFRLGFHHHDVWQLSLHLQSCQIQFSVEIRYIFILLLLRYYCYFCNFVYIHYYTIIPFFCGESHVRQQQVVFSMGDSFFKLFFAICVRIFFFCLFSFLIAVKKYCSASKYIYCHVPFFKGNGSSINKLSLHRGWAGRWSQFKSVETLFIITGNGEFISWRIKRSEDASISRIFPLSFSALKMMLEG